MLHNATIHLTTNHANEIKISGQALLVDPSGVTMIAGEAVIAESGHTRAAFQVDHIPSADAEGDDELEHAPGLVLVVPRAA